MLDIFGFMLLLFEFVLVMVVPFVSMVIGFGFDWLL